MLFSVVLFSLSWFTYIFTRIYQKLIFAFKKIFKFHYYYEYCSYCSIAKSSEFRRFLAFKIEYLKSPDFEISVEILFLL